MATDPVSEDVIRTLRDAHHGGRARWPNFDTLASGAQYRLLHRLCRRWIPNGASVLDWGAGTGHASVFLTRSGWDAAGYSFEEFSYGDLLGAGSYRFVPADPGEPVLLPFDDREFDAVLSVGVLEHVRETGGNEAASLGELLRVLRPGGVLICVHLPNAGSWIEALARRRDGTYVHPHRYRPALVRRLFEGAGFRVERRGRYGILPRNRVARVLPRHLCDSPAFTRIYDALDALGAALAPWFAQNHFVIARRPHDDDAR